MNSTEILIELTAAVADLYWTSESDYPFEPIEWPMGEISAVAVRKQLELDEEVQIETLTLSEFWEPVADHVEFLEIQQSITKLLTDVQVFRVGEIEVDIYIIGHSATDQRMGLTTKAIET